MELGKANGGYRCRHFRHSEEGGGLRSSVFLYESPSLDRPRTDYARIL